MSAFQPRPGVTVYASDNRVLILGQEIGKGGEGSVWSIADAPAQVAKFYHTGVAPDQARKLEAMCRLKSDRLLRIAAWPTALVKASALGEPKGLLMPRISGYQQAHLLYTPKSRRSSFPEAQFPFILHASTNIARAFATVHESGQVLGDVNHGNLLIANDGRVALIDCDSFEISDGRSWFPCLVGVPTYTPPELQGRSFQGLRRTPQQDAFGLAVLLFHMLFLGRHPFAGIFRHGSADKTIEDAIREFRFAYLPDNRVTEMEPPPSIPTLAEFPVEVGQLFVRAFSREGASGQRPTAREWIAPLESLSRNLKRCAVNESHHYFQVLPGCPWCRVENAFGRPMFGIKIRIIGGPDFDLLAIWRQIESVRIDEQNSTPQFTNAYIDQCKPEPRVGKIKRERRKKRLFSTGAILLALILVLPGTISPLPAICVLVIGIALMASLWRSASACDGELKSEQRNAGRCFDAAMKRWQSVQEPPIAFEEMKKKLVAQKHQFEELAPLRARKMAELKAGLRHKQLIRFLERYRIEEASIPGIGAGRKTLLRCYGVEDASDVRSGLYIRGFGPALMAALIFWRASIERQFVFNPNEPIDPGDIRLLDYELAQKRAELVRFLSAGPKKLRQILLPWEIERAGAVLNVNEAAKAIAQMDVNVRALGRF